MARTKPADLNAQLDFHMALIVRCAADTEKYGKVPLATPPTSRYPYVYPRDLSSAAQLFRRLAGSKNNYNCREQAFELLRSSALFIRDVFSRKNGWGQRYGVDGADKGIYKQEDNVAHGISIICSYILTSLRVKGGVPELDGLLGVLNHAMEYARRELYQEELNLFRSTTSIHESAMEEGYTCWVNFSFLYAFSLAHEVANTCNGKGIIDVRHMSFRESFLYSVSELFIYGSRYVRRITPEGQIDTRPDITLISPYYFGFLHYKEELDRSVQVLESKLWDPELGMIMRYLPFSKDFSTHLHAGHGPWLQYTAMVAQYHYFKGNAERGDELLELIDGHCSNGGEIPEHLSTRRRFEEFMDREWRSGLDFEKEFHKPILLDDVDFDRILEEANNMKRAYEDTACRISDGKFGELSYIQFASPLMWSHVEYARALLVKAGDWWKM